MSMHVAFIITFAALLLSTCFSTMQQNLNASAWVGHIAFENPERRSFNFDSCSRNTEDNDQTRLTNTDSSTIQFLQTPSNSDKERQPKSDVGPIVDSEGVWMYNYGGELGTVYNPVIVANGGSYYYDIYRKSGDTHARQNFLNTADWLVGHATNKGNYSLWEYEFDWPWYEGVSAPYSSALAQSLSINILATAYNITGNDCYLTSAIRAFSAFYVPYEYGGVVSYEDDGSLFLQEIAKPDFRKTYVLNGHTLSLLQIRQYYDQIGDSRAPAIFDKGIKWLVKNLHRYDTGNWSKYDLDGNNASDVYHGAHIEQLAQLYRITGQPVLKEYSDKFAQYRDRNAT